MRSYAPVAVFLIAACVHPARPAPEHAAAPLPTAPAPTPASPAASSENVLAMLVRRCGECHQGSRPTAVPAALAVFDLDDIGWPQRFDTHRFEVALERLGEVPEVDRAIFLAFHPHAEDSQIESR